MDEEFFIAAKEFIIANPVVGCVGVFCVGLPFYILYKIKIDSITNNKINFSRITQYEQRFKKFQRMNDSAITKKNGKLLG